MKITDIVKEWIAYNATFLQNLKQRRKLSQIEGQVNELYEKVHSESNPVFVLSTGRCGTALLTKVWESMKDVEVAHNPTPEPTWHANWAYHNYSDNAAAVSSVIDALRYEVIRNAFIEKKRYLESSNRITFFAFALAELYPNAKFIHIYRDAYKFVRSGVNRNWYANEVITDEGRLVPEGGDRNWTSYSQVEKIAWLWQSTNAFVEEFKSQSDSARWLTVSSEAIFKSKDAWIEINEFLDMNIPLNLIEKNLQSPVNQQRKKTDRKLTEKEIGQIDALVPLMKQYY